MASLVTAGNDWNALRSASQKQMGGHLLSRLTVELELIPTMHSWTVWAKAFMLHLVEIHGGPLTDDCPVISLSQSPVCCASILIALFPTCQT